MPELREFEEKVLDLVENVQFHPSRHQKASKFQTKISKDVTEIKSAPEIIVAADKSSNHYKISPNSYKQIKDQHINKDYKKATKFHRNKVIKTEKSSQNI